MEAPVTTIIPCYRCADTVSKAVDSVAKQTFRPAEVILVDDGSGDSTLETLFALQGAYDRDWIKVIPLERNSGASVARNTAWDRAAYEYVAFLDADDVWHPEKIALQYGWMRAHPHIPASGHRYVLVDPGAPLPALQVHSNFGVRLVTRRRLLLSNPFVAPSVMLKRDLGYRFDPAKRYCEDYYLWLRLVFDGFTMMALNTTLVYVFKRIGKSGASRDLLRMRYGDINNYWQLWRSGKLGFICMSALIAYSMLKFVLLLTVGPKIHYAIKRLIEGA